MCPCTGLFAIQYLAQHNIPVVLNTLYSPNMAPCKLFLFSKHKAKLNGERFDNNNDNLK